MGIVEDLVESRAAFERGEWIAAYERLGVVDPSALGPDDLARRATAAYLLGNTDESLQAMQQAHEAYAAAGDALAAARCAFWLALLLTTRGQPAVAQGWLARAERLLDGQPPDAAEHGYLLIHRMYARIVQGDFAAAFEAATGVTEIGRRWSEANLIAVGLMGQGRIQIYGGAPHDGLALLDEAMATVTTAAMSPVLAGMVYCSVIEACQEVSDFDRAGEWTSALITWCEGQAGLVPYTGQCAVHRGQIMRLHGAFSLALDELEEAERRYARSGFSGAAGLAHYERGEVLRILGRDDEAEAAYEQASRLGHEPHPGRALLWLAGGRVQAAAAAIRRLLAEAHDPVHRMQLLPAAVDILLGVEDPDGARAAADEANTIAGSVGCRGLRALAASSRGAVELAARDTGAALPALRAALRLWNELDAPYEAARVRVLLGRALRLTGDDESAANELRTALGAFVELGAAPAAREVERLLDQPLPGGLTSREVEVLRLVAAGRSNAQIAAALFISEKTVGRHLSNIFRKLDVSSRTAAARYAHEQHLV